MIKVSSASEIQYSIEPAKEKEGMRQSEQGCPSRFDCQSLHLLKEKKGQKDQYAFYHISGEKNEN
ncbi:MAG TPA: hypothetical protein H9700_11105 [Candidatus Eisenbergiella intestinipullorum]|nr:hypothetical protein [Candidatus Eisenbergiella intestinipullorum]